MTAAVSGPPTLKSRGLSANSIFQDEPPLQGLAKATTRLLKPSGTPVQSAASLWPNAFDTKFGIPNGQAAARLTNPKLRAPDVLTSSGLPTLSADKRPISSGGRSPWDGIRSLGDVGEPVSAVWLRHPSNQGLSTYQPVGLRISASGLNSDDFQAVKGRRRSRGKVNPLATYEEKVVPGVENFFASLSIERSLLSTLVKVARNLDGFPDFQVWRTTWSTRERAGELQTAVPPGPELIRAIIFTARNFPQLSAAAVLKRAQTTTASLKDNALDVDRLLLLQLVQATRRADRPPPQLGIALFEAPIGRTDPEIFDVAWERRSKQRPWPIPPPNREYVASIIAATRALPDENNQVVITNVAKSIFLQRLLGGNDLFIEKDATSEVIETPLLVAILSAANKLKPSDWDELIIARRQGIDDCERGGYRPRLGDCKRAVDQKYFPKVKKHLSGLTDVVWQEALRLRSEHWDLPWPPTPSLDRRLLQSLMMVSWMNSHLARRVEFGEDDGTARQVLLFAALAQLDRVRQGNAGGENVAIIRQPITDVAIPIVIIVLVSLGVLTSAVLGVIQWCGGAGLQTCAAIADFFRGLFEGEPNTQMPVPAEPPSKGDGSGGTAELPDGERPEETPPKGPKLKPFPTYPDLPDREVGFKPPKWWKPIAPDPGGGGQQTAKPRLRDLRADRVKRPWDTPWTDVQFVTTLCNNGSGGLSKFGFGVNEMLMVMISESGLNPRASTLKEGEVANKNTAMGINQMTVANVRYYEPSLDVLPADQEVYDAYTGYSRTDQLAVALKFFKAVLSGLRVHQYTELQRAAVFMYFNAGGNAHSVAEFNYAAGHGQFNSDWEVWTNPAYHKSNIGLTYWRRIGPVDTEWWDNNERVLLKDLYHAVRTQKQNSIFKMMFEVLKSCP